MRPPFNPNTFLTCPQGPRLVGTARDRACRLLDMAITQGRVLLAARLLTKDPSLITEELGEPGSKRKASVEKAIDAGMDVLVLFALEHGMPENDPSFGNGQGLGYGLLPVAIARNSPGLVSCALLYSTGLKRKSASDPYLTAALSHAKHEKNKGISTKGSQIVLMLLDAGFVPKLLNAGDAPTKLEFNAAKVLRELVIHQQYLPRSLGAAGVNTADALNLAPKGFFRIPQDPRTRGTTRDTLRKLLEMAITHGRFVTATNILTKDPSLITETLGDAGHKQMPAMAMAVCAGMEALVPFALAQGVSPCTPIYAKAGDKCSTVFALKSPRGLLDAANCMESPGLASYAMLHRADLNQTKGYDNDGRPMANIPSFLDNALWDSDRLVSLKPAASLASGGSLPLAKLLLGARINLDESKSVRQAAQLLCNSPGMAWNVEQYMEILPVILKRTGYDCINRQVCGKPLIRLAAEASNVDAVKVLIAAGANIDPEFLGTDLFAILKSTGQGAHIPALSELIMRGQIDLIPSESLAPSVVNAASQAEPGTSKAGARRLTARDVF